MTILVTGSRDWSDRREIVRRLMEEPDGTTIIEGGAMGADIIARDTARALGFSVIEVRPQWNIYGKAAGPIRNRQMLDMKPDKVLAFRKDMSRGTTDCINEAVSRKIPVEIIDRVDSPAKVRRD